MTPITAATAKVPPKSAGAGWTATSVEAVFRRVSDRSKQTLEAVDTDGEPVAALRNLITASWQVVHQFRSVLTAAERELAQQQIMEYMAVSHLDLLQPVLQRGRDTGDVATDVPLEWQATVCFSLMHAAADEVTAGRMDEATAEHAVVASILGACGSAGR